MVRHLFTLLDIVIYVTLFQSFIFMLLTVIAPVKLRVAGIITAALFIVNVINPVGHFFGGSWTADKIDRFISYYWVVGLDAAYWFAGGTFYLYAQSLIGLTMPCRRRLYLLFAPAVLYAVLAPIIAIGASNDPTAFHAQRLHWSLYAAGFLRNAYHFSLAGLLLFGLLGRKSDGARIDPPHHRADRMAAAIALTGAFSFFFAWDLVAGVLRAWSAMRHEALQAPAMVAVSVLVAHIAVMLFLNYRIFTGLVIKAPSVRVSVGTPRYHQSQIEALDAYMLHGQPYLDSRMNLERLAQAVGMPAKTLSALINTEYKKTFIEFINEYRVNEAKARLSSHTDKPISVTDLVYECGFNSKATFNRAFKNIVGKTPTEYRVSLKSIHQP